MKRVFVLLAVVFATGASAEQIEKTYTGSSGMSRTEACRSARSAAESATIYLLHCSKPDLSIGNCECEVNSRLGGMHECLVVAKVTCIDRSSSGAGGGSSSGYGGREEVMSFSTLGVLSETQAEACGSAKNEASRWASVKNHIVTHLSSCDCSQMEHPARNNGYTWTCNVDATVRPR
ncbi:MAG: hypothetical protein JSS38_14475 [Nitrospira sp.]|nr:hypothetical protein [Nitrospira sp.]